MILKKYIIAVLAFINSFNAFSQVNLDQNGVKSTVIGLLSANALQAKRYEIASLGYNSHHWQEGGLIVIELYHEYYATGYEKYIIENGYGQGTDSSSSQLKLVDSQGLVHSGKIVLGVPADLSTSAGGYVNKRLPIYFDVRYYGRYRIKITYLQDKVEVITDMNQIKIDQNSIGTDIPDFLESNDLNNNLKITGTGNHYVKNGNLGIGTTTTGPHRLAVEGSIGAREIKVQATGWSDFVFKKEYDLPTLEEVEKHIKEKGHLENIPNEEEVLKNGINLGEMNAKLLQKIEELTLYSIDQNKKIETQAKEIESLKDLIARVSELENLLKQK